MKSLEEKIREERLTKIFSEASESKNKKSQLEVSNGRQLLAEGFQQVIYNSNENLLNSIVLLRKQSDYIKSLEISEYDLRGFFLRRNYLNLEVEKLIYFYSDDDYGSLVVAVRDNVMFVFQCYEKNKCFELDRFSNNASFFGVKKIDEGSCFAFFCTNEDEVKVLALSPKSMKHATNKGILDDFFSAGLLKNIPNNETDCFELNHSFFNLKGSKFSISTSYRTESAFKVKSRIFSFLASNKFQVSQLCEFETVRLHPNRATCLHLMGPA